MASLGDYVTMSVDAKEQNSSTEDILRSIKKIIEEPAPMTTEPQNPGQAQPEDVLELTNVISKSPDPAPEPAAQEVAVAKDVLSEIDAVLNESQQPAPVTSNIVNGTNGAVHQEVQSLNGLISDQAAKASAEAIKSLVEKMPKTKIDSPNLRSGSTVEDMVIEALKPMLSDWLDKNLAIIVKQLVEKEIQKLIPKD